MDNRSQTSRTSSKSQSRLREATERFEKAELELQQSEQAVIRNKKIRTAQTDVIVSGSRMWRGHNQVNQFERKSSE